MYGRRGLFAAAHLRWLFGALMSLTAVAALCLCVGLSPRAAAVTAAAPLVEPANDGGQTTVRLMTEAQYRNTIANLFGPDIRVSGRFPPVRRSSGLLALGTTVVGMSPSDVESYNTLAYAIAGQVVDADHRGYLFPCQPADPKKADKACAARFLKSVGRLLYRRPLTDDELTRVTDQADEAAGRFNDFYTGVSFALGGMLASPKFLFVVERSEPDPAHPGQLRLTSYSLATRLSLLLWNAAPDTALLDAAESGRLQDPAVRAKLADAMIASPRFEQGLRAFFSDMLGFSAYGTGEDFDNLAKDGAIYPAFGGLAAKDAEEQSLKMLVYNAIDADGDYRDVFTTRTIFISPSLAPLYGVAAPTSGWSRYELPADSPRAGLLTQIGFLAVHAHPGRSSATRRGRGIRELVLCQKVPDPPPNVDFSIVEDPNAHFHTARERLTAHRANPTCAGCHRLTDPIGLSLENFDGAGEYRATENGAPIDASGSLDGATFDSPTGLAQAIHDDPVTTSCLVNRVFAYAVGRAAAPKDKDLLAYFEDQFGRDGYRVKALMRTIASSQALTRVSAPPPPAPPAPPPPAVAAGSATLKPSNG